MNSSQSFVASQIVYHSHQLRIDSFSVTHFSNWMNAFKGNTSDMVNFEQITDPLRPFSFLISYYFFLLLL